MKRYAVIGIGIGIAIAAVIVIGALSGFLFRANSELDQARGALSSQQQAATGAVAAAASTQERQYGLSTEAVSTLSAENHQMDSTLLAKESTNIGLLNEKANIYNQFINLQRVVNCSNSLTNIDFTNNATVSKALVAMVGDLDGSNLLARWEVIWNNSRAAIHRISGKYLWIYIVTFEDTTMGMHDAIYDIRNQCFLYIKS